MRYEIREWARNEINGMRIIIFGCIPLGVAYVFFEGLARAEHGKRATKFVRTDVRVLGTEALSREMNKSLKNRVPKTQI